MDPVNRAAQCQDLLTQDLVAHLHARQARQPADTVLADAWVLGMNNNRAGLAELLKAHRGGDRTALTALKHHLARVHAALHGTNAECVRSFLAQAGRKRWNDATNSLRSV